MPPLRREAHSNGELIKFCLIKAPLGRVSEWERVNKTKFNSDKNREKE